jgi:hypothetical protein
MSRTSRTWRWAALTAIGCVACGEGDGVIIAPEVPGSIQLTTVTAGFVKDDSYELMLDGVSQGTIGANDAMTLDGLDPATYELALGDVAQNCLVVEALASVVVGSAEAVEVSVDIVCAPETGSEYTLRFNRARPNLDNAEITECPFGLCPTEEGWDLYVYYSSGSDPNSVIRQNQTTAVEIAHVTGVSLDDLTEEHYQAASFTTELVADPFDSGRVILIKTDVGAIYALGNPVENGTAQTLTFDAVLLIAGS